MKTVVKSLIVSPAIAVALVAVTPLARWYYWDSGLSTIIPNVHRPTSGFGDEPLVAIVMFIVVYWLPFLVYDLIGRKVSSKLHGAWPRRWFVVIYALGVLLDAFLVFESAEPIADAGFAGLGMIFYTPVLLAFGNTVLLIALLVAHLNRNKQGNTI